MKTICGIDEAGRGPVIGPLVISGVMMDEKDLDKLKKLGVKDSKLLAHKKRMELSKEIKKIAKGCHAIIIHPKEIDDAVEGNNNLNLNWLEALKSAEIINNLNPDKVILDCPSPNLEKYRNFVRSHVSNKKTEVIAEHKADFKYLIVGAASIISKVIREEEVEKLRKKYGDIGPGYPSNETTKKFIRENYGKYPEIFRKSWSTFKNARTKDEQKKLENF